MVSVLESLGLSARDQFRGDTGAGIGRVVIMHGASANVIWQTVDGGEDAGLCSLAKGLPVTPVAGDWVVIADRRVVDVRNRRNELRRPHPYGREPQVMAANIDLVLIIIAVNLDLNQRLLERLSMMALDSGATPLVIVSKVDDAENVEDFCAAVKQQVPDVRVIVTSAYTGEGIDVVRAQLPLGITAVMLGASGVGKTSLLNALEGTDELTRTVSRGGEGRHATSTRKLYRLTAGGVLLDIPGIRLPEVVADQRSLEQLFEDVEELSLLCRFRNCHHDGDEGCAIAAAVRSGALSRQRFNAWRTIRATATLENAETPRERRKSRGATRGPVD
ncbi:MAG: ribosome small subunit-dependent GTPase A [Acidobacteria bacterium]|nr:ribosome small subunit-dependent GTPase A [Acidobacteriota bacterium]